MQTLNRLEKPVKGKHSSLSQKFVKSFMTVRPFLYADLNEVPSKAKLSALPANIRLGRKWLPVACQPTYKSAALITAGKSFIVQAPVDNPSA